MSSAKAFSHASTLKVNRFLKALDWTTTRLGLNAPPIVELAYLRSLPVGTFGCAWANHLDTQGLQPFTGGSRRQQLHDGVHVLTGYGTDPLGEAEVQAFLLGAKFHPIHLILMAGLLRSLNRSLQPHRILRSNVRSRLQAAYQRGQQAQFDPDTWQPETLWEQSLSAVTAQFGLGLN
ncbi:MAG: hypothetical protein F6J95_022165 [Leptolyngbya sp. SIO1E4]|nr:hypothetical protein [Leptolyngbya sp. SIO1E4]